jgi:galactarate dehydratase
MARPALTIRMQAHDNVAIVANDGGLAAGTTLPGGLALGEHLPQGHKVALVDMAMHAPVLRYGMLIGHALQSIGASTWVHERLLRLPAARTLERLPIANAKAPPMPPLHGYSFEGYRNADGSVGTRNILAITQTVQCVAAVTDFAVQRIQRELLPRFAHVDGVVALAHGYGCGVAIDAPGAEIPIRTLRHISLNPNFGGELMLVSLGCEKLQPERLMPPGSIALHGGRKATGPALDVVCLQDEAHLGFMSMVESIMRQAEVHLQRLNARRRERVPASELVVGVQCGGSDAFSGVTANPAVGFCTDLLVRAGASVMFSETTEVRDAIDQLTARAATPDVAQALIQQMAWYDAYLQRGGVDRSANTTPGNKQGGLSNIVEKAMGSIRRRPMTRLRSNLMEHCTRRLACAKAHGRSPGGALSARDPSAVNDAVDAWRRGSGQRRGPHRRQTPQGVARLKRGDGRPRTVAAQAPAVAERGRAAAPWRIAGGPPAEMAQRCASAFSMAATSAGSVGFVWLEKLATGLPRRSTRYL